MAEIILLGLGPSEAKYLTREAWEIINSVDELWVRTDQHPSVREFPKDLKIYSFNALFQNKSSIHKIYDTIAHKITQLGKRQQGVVYAMPGQPTIGDVTSLQIIKLAQEENIPIKIVSGLPLFEHSSIISDTKINPPSRIIDAYELISYRTAPYPLNEPLLISQIYDQTIAAQVKNNLMAGYPKTHPVTVIHLTLISEQINLSEIDHLQSWNVQSLLFIPALAHGTSFEHFQEIIARLRAPDGCPWDREQTHESLRQHLIEETYEVVDAIDSQDLIKMREEFGDLLLQIVLNVQIATENDAFTMAEVIEGIHDKIIRRHPHVFGDISVNGVDDVLKNWEKLKAAEREKKGEKNKSLLDGVPLSMPALSQAQEYQARAARVGFDWPNITGVFDKFVEEVAEVQQAKTAESLSNELGDLLFSLVNIIRWKGCESESVLREANQRFKRRFSFIEQQVRLKNKSMDEMSLDDLESLWQEAKRRT